MADLNRLGLGAARSRRINGHVVHYMAQGGGWLYDTLLEKEPETIEWIDGFGAGETMWDVGADVGIYSIYAAMLGSRRSARYWARPARISCTRGRMPSSPRRRPATCRTTHTAAPEPVMAGPRSGQAVLL